MKTLLSVSLIAILSAVSSAAPETWTQSLIGVTNQTATGQGLYALDFASSNGAQTVASVSTSFSGIDGAGNAQTMNFSGTTIDRSEFGRLHSYTTGSLANSYYNPVNPAYQLPDGSIDPTGTPDTMSSLGFAGFNDTLQFGGSLQAGYAARYIFHLDGTNSGHGYLADLGVKIGNDADESFFAPNGGFNSTNWATVDHLIDGTNPTDIRVQFSTQVVFDTYNLTDGASYTGTSDFSSTLTLAGIEVRDANGNLVNGWAVSSGSGTIYPVQSVPEPATLIGGLGILLPMLRLRRKIAR